MLLVLLFSVMGIGGDDVVYQKVAILLDVFAYFLPIDLK
jgi:hypothetical protein